MPTPARTGGDTALPMRDLIRMAADGIHYLAVFADHSDRPIYLGRQKRLATADQRIICYSRDGGCTRPNCVAPGYHSEVHHSPDWVAGGATDADMLFFACGPDHQRATTGQWQTTVTGSGRLAWTNGTRPPEINHAHHPDELLHNDPDPPDGRPTRRVEAGRPTKSVRPRGRGSRSRRPGGRGSPCRGPRRRCRPVPA